MLKSTPMKPNFTLSLSFDGIRLLHRTSGGWQLVGEVALDSADLAAELAGERFNVGERYGLLRAQLSLALAGPHRDEVLTDIIEITAHSRPGCPSS